jgi:hypothetical protein
MIALSGNLPFDKPIRKIPLVWKRKIAGSTLAPFPPIGCPDRNSPANGAAQESPTQNSDFVHFIANTRMKESIEANEPHPVTGSNERLSSIVYGNHV